MNKFLKGAVAAALLAGATAPAVAATSSIDPTLYSDLLTYLKAQFSYEGAQETTFQGLFDRGVITQTEYSSLQSSFAALNTAQLTLVNYLQTQVTVS